MVQNCCFRCLCCNFYFCKIEISKIYLCFSDSLICLSSESISSSSELSISNKIQWKRISNWVNTQHSMTTKF
ncbi:hypothetical protein E1A91_D02G146800v1 [Gossypium mustelinum]|uniref:Uncharacterized protein n=1 Tax=Gossypium mustelinum TaxID=34275 RepID=A0A5D2VW98_GOSMU|nr:hypothetical protein E1A91_D02G146800v1 [Gossypium mustelinum]